MKVVICASMRHLEQMKRWKESLEEKGFDVKMPTTFDTHEYPYEVFLEMTSITRPHHFKKIHNMKEGVLLVVNKDGYIGAGTFAEVAFAFALNYCCGHNIDIVFTEPYLGETPWKEELDVMDIKIYGKDFEFEVF